MVYKTLSGTGVQAVLERLTVHGLVSSLEGAGSPVFAVAEHLRERLSRPDQAGDQARFGQGDLVTDQVVPKPPELVTDQADALWHLNKAAWEIVMLCDVPRSMVDIMGELGLTHRTFFRRNHLEPLLTGGVLRMTHPGQPNHPDQAYVLTDAGVALKARRENGNSRRIEEGRTGDA